MSSDKNHPDYKLLLENAAKRIREKSMQDVAKEDKAEAMIYIGPQAIMLDLETLGTEPGCGITEIGYCLFPTTKLRSRDDIGRTGVHHTISLYDNLAHQRHISKSTLDWWEYEQTGLPIYKRKSLQSALAQTADAWNQLWKAGIKDIWSKPSLFDIPILCEAFDHLGIERPIQLQKDNFRHWNCFASIRRVIKETAPEFDKQADFRVMTMHNALSDAMDQAVQANLILSVLPQWRQGFQDAIQLRDENKTIRLAHTLALDARDKALKTLERSKKARHARSKFRR